MTIGKIILFVVAVMVISFMVAIDISKRKYWKGCEGCVVADETKGIACDTCVNHCNYSDVKRVKK